MARPNDRTPTPARPRPKHDNHLSSPRPSRTSCCPNFDATSSQRVPAPLMACRSRFYIRASAEQRRPPPVLRLGRSPHGAQTLQSTTALFTTTTKFTSNAMKFTINSFTAVACLLASAAVQVAASPVALAAAAARDVFAPPITSPTTGTVWRSGETQKVTWDTSAAPANITNPIGFILLRKADVSTPLILGQGFKLLDGEVEVTVPDVLEDSDYSIVLFGDSGDISPDFTIEGSGIAF
ncbi:hypothetical protein MKEN_01016600 [Mycena kentingensis (nom. inval.)]|nr:hypothetical protein MKEN_01016600 [Mycena kentingensis (nom. inval.)]